MESGQRAKSIFLPRLQDVLFVATLFASFLLGMRMLHVDSDLGRHLALGNYILNTTSIPTVDLFSHTLSGAERPPYEWLTQVLFALAYRLAGLDGVIMAVSLVIAAAFSFIYTQASRYSGLPLTSLFFTVLAMAASSLHWLPRPHVMTFLFLAILLERLDSLFHGKYVPVWHIPLLMLFWANLHGGFVFGFLLWLAYVAGWGWKKWTKKTHPTREFRPPLVISFILAAAASLLTPGGWKNWMAVFNNNSQYILSQTIETMPPNISQTSAWPFYILILLSVILFAGARKKAKPGHIFLLSGMAAMGLVMARNIPLFAIASAFVLPLWARVSLRTHSRWLRIEKRIAALQRPLTGFLGPVLLGLGFILFIGGRQFTQKDALFRFDKRVFPVQAADWLESHPQSGNMFNEINWGGYLLYRLWPAQQVFLDSQTDFYGETLVRDYQTALNGNWQVIFDTYEVEWALLSKNAQLKNLLVGAGWKILYTDETTEILRMP